MLPHHKRPPPADGRRSSSRPAGRRSFLSGSTWPQTPQCQDRHAPAQQRSQRVQLAGRQLRQPHPGVAHALVVSADGLPVAVSQRLDRPKADQLAAIASGLASLTQGGARLIEGGLVKQTVVEMDRGLLVVMAISDGSCPAVLAGSSCDVGVVAYEMTVLVSGTGEVLTPSLRAELQGALPP
jgi:uncharacterized protein